MSSNENDVKPKLQPQVSPTHSLVTGNTTVTCCTATTHFNQLILVRDHLDQHWAAVARHTATRPLSLHEFIPIIGI